MTKSKTTRRALLSSCVALMLCFSMLLGTTYAWFTDTASSAVNMIQAGTLDVQLLDATGASLEGQPLVFHRADQSTNDILWEPGATYYTQAFQIKNAGSLHLKYQIVINGVTNGYSKLLEAIDFKVTTEDPSRNEPRMTEEQFNALPGIDLGGIVALAPGASSEVLYLVGHMKEEAGNEYQGLKIEGVGITVYATQVEAEFDSFDNNYDSGAAGWLGETDITWYTNAEDGTTEYEISSVADLAGLAAIVNGTAVSPVATFAADGETNIKDSFKGKTIKLVADIDLNNMNWVPIGYNGNDDEWNYVFEGTFDGQGHTISNLSINAPEGEGVGLFGVAQNAIINGINVENVDITGYSMVATIVGSPYTGCTISDCHVTGDISLVAEWAYVGGVVGYGYTKIDNCSVIAEGTGVIISETRNAVGGIAAWLLEDASSITNCQVKNLDLTGWANIGAITGFMHRLGVIDNCSAEYVTLTKTRLDGHPTIGLAAGGWSYNASKAITITNNTFKNITLNGTYLAISSADILYGAEYAGNTSSNFVLENNTQENITNNLVEVAAIKTRDDLQTALDNATGDATIVLSADITGDVTVNQKESVNITIDGNGKTYTGSITINGNARSTGAETLTIQNINFVSSEEVNFIYAPSKIDGKYNYSHNVTVDNCTFAATEYNESVVGVHVNSSYNLKVTNCSATNMHSLLQAESCSATVTVDGCETINCKSGVSFNNTRNAVVKNSTIESVADGGYGVRVKAEQNNYSLTVENCEIKAFIPVLVRNAKATYTANFSGSNTLTATNDYEYDVVVCNGDWDDDSVAPDAPTGNITLTGVDSFNVFKG